MVPGAMKSVVALTCTLLMPPAGLPSNVAPLAFGMTPQDVAVALGAPLTYVSGHPGNEVYVAVAPAGVPGFQPVDQAIHLEFRNGCLSGWKAHWGMRHPPF
jgi:hypothetical protein